MSYLTAWLSRDLIRAAHQQITQEWCAEMQRAIEKVCEQQGCKCPNIYTPEELPGGKS